MSDDPTMIPVPMDRVVRDLAQRVADLTVENAYLKAILAAQQEGEGDERSVHQPGSNGPGTASPSAGDGSPGVAVR